MSEKFNFQNETVGCSVCGAENIFRDGKCSKCVVESEYDEVGSEFDEQDGKAPKSEIHMHSAGLRQSTNRGAEKIIKVKPAKIEIRFKK